MYCIDFQLKNAENVEILSHRKIKYNCLSDFYTRINYVILLS